MIEIREAGTRDLPSVLELYGREELGDPEVPDLPAARAVLGRMRRSPGRRLFVALSGGRVVGTFALEECRRAGCRKTALSSASARRSTLPRGAGLPPSRLELSRRARRKVIY